MWRRSKGSDCSEGSEPCIPHTMDITSPQLSNIMTSSLSSSTVNPDPSAEKDIMLFCLEPTHLCLHGKVLSTQVAPQKQ